MSYDYGYNYAYDAGSALGGMLAGMLVFILIFSLIALVFAVLMIIGQWKCFKKAGYNGWESLIAGHNQFVNCTFAGANPILVLVLMFGSVVSIIPILGALAYLGFVIYYQFHVGIKTAKAFGKGTGFGVALAIPVSAPIAWFILGKDDVKYVGVNNGVQNAPVYPQPQMNQYVQQPVEPMVVPTEPTVNPQPQMNEFMQQPVEPMAVPTEPTVNPQSVQNNACSRCGAPTNPGDRFCMNCGNQL
jgi:hypothetical protein